MQIPSFGEPQQQQLQELCDGSDFLYSYHYVNGLVFAVAAAPEIPMPEQWIPWVFSSDKTNVDQHTAEQLTELLMSLFRNHLQQMRDSQVELPVQCEFPQDHNPESPLSLWCRGLLAGHGLLEGIWQQAWQRVQEESMQELQSEARDLQHMLSMLSSFANIPMALNALQGDGREKLQQNLPLIYQALPRCLQQYVELSGTLAGFLPDQFETFVKVAENTPPVDEKRH